MLATEMQERMAAYIRERSGFETRRTYVGMSHLGDCPADLWVDYQNGLEATEYNHRMAYLGYALEKVIKDILRGAGILASDGCEIVASFDNRVRGHTDGETTDGDLLEIKTVSKRRFECVLETGRALGDHFQQVQAYMHFSEYRHAEIVYVCREDLRHFVVHVGYRASVGERIEAKARKVLAAIDEGRQPACECARRDNAK